MRVVVIYESLTGNTRKAAELMVRELARRGHEAIACAITAVNYQALSRADIVVVGTWTDGILVVGQRPGRANRLRQLPVLEGKRCIVYCTYAIDPGRVLDKMTAILEGRGARVLGGMTLRRDRLATGVPELVDRLLSAVGSESVVPGEA